MSTITVEENRLEELIEKSVRKHFEINLDDVEEVRRSPAGAIVRIETRLDAIERNIEKNVATKSDLANLKIELGERIAKTEKVLGERIANLKIELSERIAKTENDLGERINTQGTDLKDRISDSENSLSVRIARLETTLKLIIAILLSLVALMIKSVFFP